VAPFFKKVINSFKQMNFCEFGSDQFKQFETELQQTLQTGAQGEVA
jgi:V/A-type H+-transporting ATPase subunit A